MNKNQSIPQSLRQNQRLNYLVNSSFQAVHILFVLSFENDAQRISNKIYYLPNIETKDYNVTIDGKTFFDQPVKNDKTSEKLLVKEMAIQLAAY